jgi:F0F1-type ATP synthase epsilon subunit
MNTFNLTISAYNTIIYKGSAVYCGITTLDGALGIEARHEPVLGVLKENSLIVFKDAHGMEKSIQILSGMLSFKNNECMIIIDTAEKNN